MAVKFFIDSNGNYNVTWEDISGKPKIIKFIENVEGKLIIHYDDDTSEEIELGIEELMDEIDKMGVELLEIKQSVSNGKKIIATSITGKGIDASGNETFQELGSKIDRISTNSGDFDINGSEKIEVTYGEPIQGGDVVRIMNVQSEFEKQLDPLTVIEGEANGCSFSNNGKYLAIAHNYAPYISVYKIDKRTLTLSKIDSSLFSGIPTGHAQACCFSSDDKYLCVSHNTSPFITLYEVDNENDRFTKLNDDVIDVIPTGVANDCTFSPNDKYLCVASGTSPFFSIYKVDKENNTFTKLNNPDYMPKGIRYGCNFNADGSYFALTGTSSPYVNMYTVDYDTNTFTEAKNFSAAPQPTRSCYVSAFSPDGRILVIGMSTNSYIRAYKIRPTGEFEAYVEFGESMGTNAAAKGVSFSPDSKYCAVTNGAKTDKKLIVYMFNGDDYQRVMFTPEPVGSVSDCCFNNEGDLLCAVSTLSPFITLYSVMETGLYAFKQTTTDYFNQVEGIGIALEHGGSNTVHNVKKILGKRE